MPKIIFIDHNDAETTVETEAGETVMRAALDAGLPGIIGDCGGELSCATCHGYVDPAWVDRLPPPSADEQDLLECALNPRENSRLCCQLKMSEALDGLIVRLPESQL